MPRRKNSKPSVFSTTLRALLEERNISVRQAARIAKVPLSTLSAWVAGGAAPSDFEAVQRLADHLGVSLSLLLLGRDGSSSGKGSRRSSVNTVLKSDGFLYSGYAKITVEKLVPRENVSDDEGEDS